MIWAITERPSSESRIAQTEYATIPSSAAAEHIARTAAAVARPSRRPCSSRRARWACSAAIAALAAAVPLQGPAGRSRVVDGGRAGARGLVHGGAHDEVGRQAADRRGGGRPRLLEREERAGQQQVQPAER